MKWPDFLRWNQEHRDRALAAVATLEGDRAPAAALLRSWRFAVQPDLVNLVLNRLIALKGDATTDLMRASLDPPGDIAPSERLGRAPPSLHRAMLERHALRHPSGATPLASRSYRLAWALDELALLGGEIETRQRQAWASRVWREDEDWDRRAARLWKQLFSGDQRVFYEPRPAWNTFLLRPARNAFRAELLGLRIPRHVADHQAVQMEEAFGFQLMFGPHDSAGRTTGAPGWLELALRVLETDGVGPVLALARRVPEQALGSLAVCATSRGYWSQTAARAWPELQRADGRAVALRQRIRCERDHVEVMLDLHVALRLLEGFESPGPGNAEARWAVVRNNRGRARARLRALMARQPLEIVRDQILSVPALAARTVAAMRWYARDWACAELRSDFAFSTNRQLTPPCTIEDETPEPFDDVALAPLDTWLLLVALKGRWARLIEWVRLGRTTQKDATFYRLLAEALPRTLTDQRNTALTGRCFTYDQLRLHLRHALPDHSDTVRAWLTRISAICHTSDTSSQVLLSEVIGFWHPAVPCPERGFEMLLREAKSQLAALTKEEAEWTQSA